MIGPSYEGMSSPGLDLPVDVAILAALAVEQAAIVDAVGNCSAQRWRGLDLHIGDIAGQRVLVFSISQMGNVSAAQATVQVIDAWNPARLLLVGIAGGSPGASTDMRPGDILIPDQVVGYELAKVTRGSTERRYEVYRSDTDLLDHARSLRPADWADTIAVPRPDDPSGRSRPLVHIGPVLTGDKIIADSTALAELRLAWPKAVGVEMESLGVALAAYRNGVGFLMVKAVSDFADDNKSDMWHRYAASAAARFAVAVLARASAAARGRRQSPRLDTPQGAYRPDMAAGPAGLSATNVTGDSNVLYTNTSITTGTFTGRDSVDRQGRQR